jgi:hypothetical protein
MSLLDVLCRDVEKEQCGVVDRGGSIIYISVERVLSSSRHVPLSINKHKTWKRLCITNHFIGWDLRLSILVHLFSVLLP